MAWIIGAAIIAVVWCLVAFPLAVVVGRAFSVGAIDDDAPASQPEAAAWEIPGPRSAVSQDTPASV